MSEPLIRRRSLPDSLRWLADKLDTDTIPEADRAGVAFTLRALADEICPPPPCNAPGDAPNSLGTERCELPAGHEGRRHKDGNTSWPQGVKRPVIPEGSKETKRAAKQPDTAEET